MKQTAIKAINWCLDWEKHITLKDGESIAIWGVDRRHWEADFHRLASMSKEDARKSAYQFYHIEFWDALGCNDLPYPLDWCVFDAGVNMGKTVAKSILKDTINYEDYLLKRIIKYIQITMKSDKFRKFFLGWVRRVTSLYMEVRIKEEVKEEIEEKNPVGFWDKLSFIWDILKIKKKVSIRGVSSMKSGMKSSEFWMGLIVALLIYLNSFWQLGIDEETIKNLVLVAITYIGGRSVVKLKNG